MTERDDTKNDHGEAERTDDDTNGPKPETAPDPFNPERLTLKGTIGEAIGVRRLLVTVPVRKPTKQEFVRTHPDPNFRLQLAILELKTVGETYAVLPEVAMALPGETRPVLLTTTITRQGNVFLWPVPLPQADGREMAWHTSAREAAERATGRWVRIVANRSGGHYDVFEADASIAEPQWPDYTLQQLLKVAFGNGKLIDREDHPILQQLLGRA